MYIDRKEIEFLNESFSKMERTGGEGKTIIVSSEAGTGKTTLINKFIRDIYESTDRKMLSGYGYCINMNYSTRNYFPWKEALIELDTNFLIIKYLHGSPEKGTQYKKIIKTAFDGTGADWIKSIPQIGNISALIYKTIKELKKGFETQEAADKIKKITEGISFNNSDDIFAAITEKLRNLSQSYPVILFIDDIQWLDISSRDLFFYMSKNLKENPFPMLLIAAYNTDEAVSNGKDNNDHDLNSGLKDLLNNLKKFETAEFITLDKLSSDQSENFINISYPENIFTESFKNKIINITDGNIFFIKQILENLEEENIIYRDSGKFLNKDIEGFYKLPETINDSFSEKWEKLDDEYRQILQIASVMGEDFSVEIISSVLDINMVKLFMKIEKLIKVNRIIINTDKEYGSLTKIFRFVNTLFQRYVYASIESDFKLEYHKLIADNIKSRFTENNIMPVLPQYLFHLGIGNRIIDINNNVILTKEEFRKDHISDNFREYYKYLSMTAENHIKSYSNEEAVNKIETLMKLSEISDDAEEFLKHKIQKGNILTLTGKLDAAESVFSEVLTAAEDSGQSDIIAESSLCIGNLKMRRGYSDQAEEFFKRSLKLFEETKNKKGISKTLSNIGINFRKNGDPESAVKQFKSSVEIRNEIGDTIGLAMNYSQIGNIFNNQGNWDEAEKYYDDAIKIAEEYGDRKLLADFLSNAASIRFRHGDYVDAIEILERSLNLHEKVFNVKGIAETKHNLASNYYSKGNITNAVSLYSESALIFKKLDDIRNMASAYLSLATVYFETGDPEKAVGSVDTAIGFVLGRNFYSELIKLLSFKANILFVMNNMTGFLKTFEQADKILIDNIDIQIPVFYRIAKARKISLGSESAGIKAFNEIIDEYNNKTDRAQILFEMSRTFKNKDYVSESIALYEEIYSERNSYSEKLRIDQLKNSK